MHGLKETLKKNLFKWNFKCMVWKKLYVMMVVVVSSSTLHSEREEKFSYRAEQSSRSTILTAISFSKRESVCVCVSVIHTEREREREIERERERESSVFGRDAEKTEKTSDADGERVENGKEKI